MWFCFAVGTNLPLTFAPENGHMLGGTMVNMTGPCFELDMRVTCRFNTKDSEGVVIDENRHGFLIILQITCLSKVGLIAVDLGWVEFGFRMFRHPAWEVGS